MNSQTKSSTSDSERWDSYGRNLESGDESRFRLEPAEAIAGPPAFSLGATDTPPLAIKGCPNPAMPDFLAKISEALSRCQCNGKVSAETSRMLQSLAERVHRGDTLPTLFGPENSAFSPWPVQIMLIPSNAPFLHNADLLVMGNCIPQLFPALPKELLEGRVVMMGCPALDSFERHVAKFSRICRNANLRRITTLTMEVHCCDGLNLMVESGRAASGMNIPMGKVVLDTSGQIQDSVNAA
jgi:hypothetical protein